MQEKMLFGRFLLTVYINKRETKWPLVGWIVGLEPTIEHHHCAISQPIVTKFVIFIFFTLSLYVMVGLVSDFCEGDITKLYNTHVQKPITKHLKTRGGELLLC